MDITILTSLVTALGGLGLVKFLAYLSPNRRSAAIKTQTEEFESLRARIEWLAGQCLDHEKRIAELTAQLLDMRRRYLLPTPHPPAIADAQCTMHDAQ